MECSAMAGLLLLLLVLLACACARTASADQSYYMSGHPLQQQQTQSPPPYGKPAYSSPLALSVEGVVFCQSCLYTATTSLQGATPLKGVRVQLACRDRRYKTFLYETALTDDNGYFLIRVPRFDYTSHNALRTCRVFLLSSSSSSPSCSRRTNINSGRYGAYLRLEKAYSNQALYSAGPFAFAPSAPCKPAPYPPTHHTTSPAYSSSPPPSSSSSPTPSPPPPSTAPPRPSSSPTPSPPPPSYTAPTTSTPTYSPPPPPTYSPSPITYKSPPPPPPPPTYSPSPITYKSPLPTSPSPPPPTYTSP